MAGWHCETDFFWESVYFCCYWIEVFSLFISVWLFFEVQNILRQNILAYKLRSNYFAPQISNRLKQNVPLWKEKERKEKRHIFPSLTCSSCKPELQLQGTTQDLILKCFICNQLCSGLDSTAASLNSTVPWFQTTWQRFVGFFFFPPLLSLFLPFSCPLEPSLPSSKQFHLYLRKHYSQ